MAYRGLGQAEPPADDTVEGNDTVDNGNDKVPEEDKKAGWLILALLAGGAYFILKK